MVESSSFTCSELSLLSLSEQPMLSRKGAAVVLVFKLPPPTWAGADVQSAALLLFCADFVLLWKFQLRRV